MVGPDVDRRTATCSPFPSFQAQRQGPNHHQGRYLEAAFKGGVGDLSV